jgi:hypothetical protein
VQSLTGLNNYTLPSHLRLRSLFVVSYDAQGLRWKYSNPAPHGAYGCYSYRLNLYYDMVAESSKQLLGNGQLRRFIGNGYALNIRENSEAVFSMRSMLRLYSETVSWSRMLIG